MQKERLIKSKERVKERGEVFTPSWLVKDMCDTIPSEIWESIESTFLEPACGNGNFLVEIYARKLQWCKTEKEGLKALSSIYGIDIMPDNCTESRVRLAEMFVDKFPDSNDFARLTALAIVNNNIICGDSLEIQRKWERENVSDKFV